MTHSSTSLDSTALAIDAQHVVKTYPNVEALRGVSLQLPQQGVYGILGPNGAGKTTLLNILTTITRPTSGEVSILGYNALTDPFSVRQQLGVVAQGTYFDKYLTIWQNLCLHAQLHGMKACDYKPRILSLLDQIRLRHKQHAMPDELSGGMKRRMVLIRALIHQPKLLFLDEPTTGLDPEARQEIWALIENLRQHATIVLTTHYMEEADALCDSLLLLHQGKIVKTGTPRQLKAELAPVNTYELTLTAPKADFYQPLLSPYVSQLRCIDAYRLEFTHTGPLPAHLFDIIDQQDFEHIGKIRPDLEDVYMAMSHTQQQENFQ